MHRVTEQHCYVNVACNKRENDDMNGFKIKPVVFVVARARLQTNFITLYSISPHQDKIIELRYEGDGKWSIITSIIWWALKLLWMVEWKKVSNFFSHAQTDTHTDRQTFANETQYEVKLIFKFCNFESGYWSKAGGFSCLPTYR